VAAEGFAAESGRAGVVVLTTTLTDDLVDEGLLREVVSRIQGKRKDGKLGFTDRIEVSIAGSERIERICRSNEPHVAKETLADRVVVGESLPGAERIALGDETFDLAVRPV